MADGVGGRVLKGARPGPVAASRLVTFQLTLSEELAAKLEDERVRRRLTTRAAVIRVLLAEAVGK